MRTGLICLHALVVLALAISGCEPKTIKAGLDPRVKQAETIAVLPLLDAPGLSESGCGMSIRGVLVREAVHLGRYRVLSVNERQIKDALHAEGYEACDLGDPVVMSALARRLGTDMVLGGELLQYETTQDQSSTVVYIVSGGGSKTMHRVGISLRLVARSDGQVLYTGYGWAVSDEGFTEAAQNATAKALEEFKELLGKS